MQSLIRVLSAQLPACGVLWCLVLTNGVLFADKPPVKKVDWEAKYTQLLKERPDIRRKVENGGATKEQVIEWMKKGGDTQKRTGKQYYGATLKLEDPAGFYRTGTKRIYSGPQPGEPLPSFQAIHFRGKDKGQVFDPVAAAQGKPLVLIFQNDSVVGQKGLLLCGGFLGRIAQRAPRGLAVTSIFLADDPSPKELFPYDFIQNIDPVVDISIGKDGRDGPGALGLNRNVAMTIIIAKDGKVLYNFALPQPMLYPDPHVFGAIADAIGVDHSTMLGWFQPEKKQK